MPPQTNKPYQPPKKTRPSFVVIAVLLGIGLAGLILLNRQAVYDWLRLRNYTPPAAIAQLAAADGLTDSARHVFYVNHPAIEGKSAFAQSCPNGNKETAVLGCYVPAQRGIYVLSVSDPRLKGIEEVTAAHEMLHAAYDRLSSDDKKQVNGWLQEYYDSLTDQTIKDQIDSYKKTEPNDLVNEMHSIFGSEVVSLPPSLEHYYSRYFTDRAKVTGYYTAYQAEFTTRQNQIKQDDVELKQLKSQIQTEESDLKTKQAQLAAQQQTLENERARGNASAYNAGVPTYNALVESYNAEVQNLRALLSQYNTLVAARNALVLEEQQLVQDISSNVSTVNSQ